MAIQRICDICNAKIDTAGRDNCVLTNGVMLYAPTVESNSPVETCLGCLKTVVRTLGERFPNAPTRFYDHMKTFLRRISELEKANEQWHRDHPNAEEG